jgi:hypothetical protein
MNTNERVSSNADTTWKFGLAPLGRLLVPAVIFTPVVLGAFSASPSLNDLGSAILAENQAPRSFWTVVAVTAWGLALYLWFTRTQNRQPNARLSRIVQAPMDLVRGWLTAMSGMAVPLGFLALNHRMFGVGIFAFVAAGVLAYTLDLGEFVLRQQLQASYDPVDPEQRQIRLLGVVNSVVIAIIATCAAFSIVL